MPVILAHDIGSPVDAAMLLVAALFILVAPPLIALAALVPAWRANRSRTKKLIVLSGSLLVIEVCGVVWNLTPMDYGETREFLSSGLFLLLFIIGVPLGVSLLAWFLLGDREKKLLARPGRAKHTARIFERDPTRRRVAEKRS